MRRGGYLHHLETEQMLPLTNTKAKMSGESLLWVTVTILGHYLTGTIWMAPCVEQDI